MFEVNNKDTRTTPFQIFKIRNVISRVLEKIDETFWSKTLVRNFQAILKPLLTFGHKDNKSDKHNQKQHFGRFKL